MPWLRVHNPSLDWETLKVTFNSEYCNQGCIGVTQEEVDELEDMELVVVSEWEKGLIPEEYHKRLGAFDIEKAHALPPSRGEYDFKIDFIPDAKIPPPAKPYRLTPLQMEEARSQIDELETSGMILKSTSRMAAPLFFIPKKDGGQRMCIDYRKLNEITIRDAYPLPNMESLLEAARGARVFSKFDLRSTYNMFRVRPGDQWKTAFVTPWGLYEFNVMHYSFVNAPACLQRYMDHILAPLIYKVLAQVTVYMDNIGTFGKDVPNAIDLNTKVLTILEKVQLYCKAEKCAFHKDQIDLLGVTINSGGFGLEDKKVSNVRSWPVPTNLTALKGFIGFRNFYQRFLRNFSIIARPLHDLDKKGIPWSWGPEQQAAFDKIKELIMLEPCLAHTNLNKPFRLETDASDFAYGATLSQKQKDNKIHPVAFMSKSMLPAERNYDAYNKEALGIVKPLQYWRYWLQGTKKPIEIRTDHKNLLSGFNNKPTPSKRHLHWLEILRQYNYEVGYRSGKQNTVADILSRRTDHYPDGVEPPAFKPFPEDKMRSVEDLEMSALEYELEGIEPALEYAFICLIDSDATLLEEIRSLVMEEDPKGEEGKIWVPNKNDLY